MHGATSSLNTLMNAAFLLLNQTLFFWKVKIFIKLQMVCLLVVASEPKNTKDRHNNFSSNKKWFQPSLWAPGLIWRTRCLIFSMLSLVSEARFPRRKVSNLISKVPNFASKWYDPWSREVPCRSLFFSLSSLVYRD